MRMEKETPLLFENSYVNEDDIWFSAMDFNGLFKANLLTGQVQFMGCFPKESSLKRRLHFGKTICVDECLYFIPWGSSHLHVYDMREQCFFAYEIEGEAQHKYSSAIEANDAVYFFPAEAEKVLKFSYKTKQIEYLDPNGASRDLQKIYRYQLNVMREDEYVFFSLKNDNVVMMFHADTETFRLVRVGDAKERFLILAKKDNIVYLKVLNQPEIVLWNYMTEREERRVWVRDGIENNSWIFGDKILGNNWKYKGIQIVDLNTMQEQNGKWHEEVLEYHFVLEIMNAFVYGEKLYYVWSGDGAIYSADTQERCWQFLLTEKLKQRVKGEMQFAEESIVYEESNFFGLEDYIEYVKNYSPKEANAVEQNVGKTICDMLL